MSPIPSRVRPVLSPDLQDLCREPLNIATYSIYKLWASWFQKRRIVKFSHYKSMGANDPRGCGLFGPQGLEWQDLCPGPLNIATNKINKPWASLFPRRIFCLSFPHNTSMVAIYGHGGHLD